VAAGVASSVTTGDACTVASGVASSVTTGEAGTIVSSVATGEASTVTSGVPSSVVTTGDASGVASSVTTGDASATVTGLASTVATGEADSPAGDAAGLAAAGEAAGEPTGLAAGVPLTVVGAVDVLTVDVVPAAWVGAAVVDCVVAVGSSLSSRPHAASTNTLMIDATTNALRRARFRPRRIPCLPIVCVSRTYRRANAGDPGNFVTVRRILRLGRVVRKAEDERFPLQDCKIVQPDPPPFD
jgi:hypothetical protein